MERHKVRTIIGVVVLLLAVTLLTGFASPPSAEAEVPLFFVDYVTYGEAITEFLVFFIFLPLLIGSILALILVIWWAWRNPFDKKAPDQQRKS